MKETTCPRDSTDTRERRRTRIRKTLTRLDNEHVWMLVTTCIVTGFITLVPPTFVAWILFVLIWLMQSLDVFDLYLHKINKMGRIFAKAGLI